MVIFDIETGPLSDEELREMAPPFEPPAHPGEFDPDSVAYGNTKDPVKREEKLNACLAAHNKLVAGYGITLEAARTKHWTDFVEKAALSPLTGQVVAIGYRNDAKNAIRVNGLNEFGSEAEILSDFWKTFDACKAKQVAIAGWNIAGFDVPFIVRRSWYHGIDTPSELFDPSGRYLSRTFVDLMQRFSAGKWGDNVKLDTAARFFGVGQKNGEGKEFAKLWLAGGESQEQARLYLLNDLAMTNDVAKRMGMV